MDDGTCPLPVCSTTIKPIRKRRDVVSYLSSDSAISFDAVSQEIEVLQPGSPSRKPKCSEATKIERYIPEGSVCVSKIAFSLVSVATITVAIITLGIVIYFTIRRVQYSDVPSTD
uniref:Uncharacterized protein n=1 Tax=Panagrolaimus superbus TaxID=310955 RepID=A0A914Y8J1_9BILA